ncbi:hypothetical protein [Streptomyces zingiberis]|uniref:Uncharacterized protein n=1 Tax=Streptomyces zingiberis TaxID=2053010 RepID=A0ABX1BWV8_9ACTN|nr:hypothetical protein [Streptomyces zingiberis]NJQ00980.1 hypothetical protein [Streptomyces zingiberis]
METTGVTGTQEAPQEPSPGPPGGTAPDALAGDPAAEGYLRADFPWYGLDAAFTGPRWLCRVGTAADGTVEHGSTGHGEVPSYAGTEAEGSEPRFTVVVTVADRPVRSSADGTGTLEASSVSSAAWLAGSGLLSRTWPNQMEHSLRDDWLEQQTALAWELADDLEGPAWSVLSLPVDGTLVPFHYRESEYGWVLAGRAPDGVLLGAYGRGMSAYGLGFSVIGDLTAYAR